MEYLVVSKNKKRFKGGEGRYIKETGERVKEFRMADWNNLSNKIKDVVLN